MVRDPSDGSVREKPEPTISKETSGLRDPSGRADYQKRLDASREWLKEYKTQKASRGIT